jgi:hypothetical protein
LHQCWPKLPVQTLSHTPQYVPVSSRLRCATVCNFFAKAAVAHDTHSRRVELGGCLASQVWPHQQLANANAALLSLSGLADPFSAEICHVLGCSALWLPTYMSPWPAHHSRMLVQPQAKACWQQSATQRAWRCMTASWLAGQQPCDSSQACSTSAPAWVEEQTAAASGCCSRQRRD